MTEALGRLFPDIEQWLVVIVPLLPGRLFRSLLRRCQPQASLQNRDRADQSAARLDGHRLAGGHDLGGQPGCGGTGRNLGVSRSFSYLNETQPERTQHRNQSGRNRSHQEMPILCRRKVEALVCRYCIATPDHWHAPIAIAAARAGKHVFLEKPMTHSIEEAIELRNTIKSTGVVFQLGHENRQQMSFRIAKELINKGVLGTVSMIQTHTNRNGLDGAWIRKRKFDDQGSTQNINWKEFLGNTPWHEFDRKRYFNWHRFSEYGTGFIGNDFSHQYDCINQVMRVGIPEKVIALGGQYYYKDCGDMPDVMNAVFSYPKKGLTVTYDGTLKNGIYRENYIMGSEAAMYLDLGIKIFKDDNSERYKDNGMDSSEPLYLYNGGGEVDAVSSATARAYMKGGYGATFIDGKVIDASFLHVKEWIDAIRNQTPTSCNIDEGFDEAVTFNLANLAYVNNKQVFWDPITEKVTMI